MLNIVTLGAPAPAAPSTCGLPPGDVPAAPAMYVDVYPLFRIPAASWKPDVGSDRTGWSQQLNYDFKQVFPKITMCEGDMLARLSTTFIDCRVSSGGPYTRSIYTWVVNKWVRTADLTSEQRSLARTSAPPTAPETTCISAAAKAGYIDASDLDVGAWAVRAVGNAAALEPIMVKYGYPASSAKTLARMLVSKYALLRSMWKISARQALDWSNRLNAPVYPQWRSADDTTLVRASDFVSTYKGLTNPYTHARATGPAPAFKPVFDGRAFLWNRITPPFPSDADHDWCLFAEFKGGSTFRLSLKKLTIDKPLWKDIVGVLKTIVSYLCDKITNEDLQLVRNTAGAVPEPTTQAVVKAWTVAAAACGMAFPAALAPAACPEAPLPEFVEPSFWDQHQQKILIGAGALVALLAVKQFAGRGKVRP